MIKALILASNIHQFRNFCREFQLNPHKDVKLVSDWTWDCQGWWVDMPVILLDGYQYNQDYTLGLMRLIGYRFENIHFLSKGEIYGN